MTAVRYPDIKAAVKKTAAYRRVTLFLDDNSDWLWMPFVAIVAILLSAIFAMSFK